MGYPTDHEGANVHKGLRADSATRAHTGWDTCQAPRAITDPNVDFAKLQLFMTFGCYKCHGSTEAVLKDAEIADSYEYLQSIPAGRNAHEIELLNR
jgi:hypothetical protein